MLVNIDKKNLKREMAIHSMAAHFKWADSLYFIDKKYNFK